MPARPRVGGVLAGVLAAVAGVTAGLLVIGAAGQLDSWPFGDDPSGTSSSSAGAPGGPATPDPVAAPPVLPAGVGTPAPSLPTTAGLTSALAGALRAPALGTRVGMVVVDPASGATLYSSSATTSQKPASTAKLVTAASALHFVGPDTRLVTRTVTGATPGEVVLVGGGDPTLAVKSSGPYPRPASLTELARQTAAAVKAAGRTSVALVLDDSRFTGPRTGPGWLPADVANGLVSPVSALTVDEGAQAARVTDRTVAAGRAFVSALRKQGVTVTSTTRGVAAPTATPLGSVSSPPVSALVEEMLLTSDNDISEALAHNAGFVAGTGGSFAGGSAAGEQALTWLGLDPAAFDLVDGSGISPLDRLQAGALGELVVAAAKGTRPELASMLSGLPVSGVSGSLADRFDTRTTTPARGHVRAKTGTLTGANSLAGTVADREGRTLVFVVVADRSSTDTFAARAALDRVAAVLAACGCR